MTHSLQSIVLRTVTLRAFSLGAVLSAFIVGMVAFAPTSQAGIVSLDEALSKKVMGSPDALVELHEYSSLACPHCAAFHRDTLPILIKEYVDTGKVRLVYHDFPLGSEAMAAAMLARCAGNTRYFGLLDLLFKNQSTWSRSSDPVGALTQIVRFAGMSPQDVSDCLKNADLFNAIRNRANEASQDLGIDSTPTFYVNDTRIPGAMPVSAFRDVIEKALTGQ